MNGKNRFSGSGFEQGEFTPAERAQVRELLREMIANYLHIEPDVLEKMKAAATVMHALSIIGRVLVVVGPIGGVIGAILAMKGGL